jgi:hypothetical protein
LTAEERCLLDGLLAYDFPGIQELRVQARERRARKGCTCGCGTIDLIVQDLGLPPSAAVSPVPVEGRVRGVDGEDVGGVLLFLSKGLLASFEVYSYGEPLALPRSDQVTWEDIKR